MAQAATSTGTRNVNLIRRFVTLVMERGLVDACDELFHPEVRFIDPAIPPDFPVDGRGFRDAVQVIHQHFEDYTVRSDDIFPVGDDTVVQRFTGHAVHKGGYFGSKLVNKPITWTGNAIYRFQSARIHRIWMQWDLLGTLVQLGIVQAPTATTPPPWAVPPVPGTPFVASDRTNHRATGVIAPVEANIATVQRMFAGIMSEPIESLLAHCISPDYQRTDNCAVSGAPSNVAGFVRYINVARECFHTYRMDIDEIMGEGDKVVARVHAHGKHKGGFLGVAAGGQDVDFTLAFIFRLDNARIAHSWVTWDVYRALHLLGALPPPPTSLA